MSIQHTQNGYSFIPGVLQYSSGVAALPGFRLERVMFSDPLPLKAGFTKAAHYLQVIGAPLSALCACELRSPAPFTEEGFQSFNRHYVQILSDWGVLIGDVNPIARSNVCPLFGAPETPSLHAFTFAVPSAIDDNSFIIAGSAESPEGQGDYRDGAVCYGNTSPVAMTRKGIWVIEEMERRMALFGKRWSDTTAVQLYTVHDIHHFTAQELAARGVMQHGLTWHFNRPPVEGLEYEMDCRSLSVEHVATP